MMNLLKNFGSASGVARPLLVALLMMGSSSAWAAEVTRLTSSFEKDNPFDAHLSASYRYELNRGAIKRELVGDTGQSSLRMVKEGRYSQVRHILDLRAEIGIWHNLQLHIGLPIVLGDSRTLSFAQNGSDPCTGDGPAPSITDHCVTPNNSTLVRDGFLDRDALLSNNFRVIDWGGSDPPAGGLLLPNRAGVDQLHIGVSWAPVTQKDDPTKPTFALGFEARFAVGSIMRYDPNRPKDNTAVGQGIHQMHWWLAVSRRFNPYVDPYISIFYMLPLATSSSLFSQTEFEGSGQERAGPQQVGGLKMGLELIPWEQPARNNKLSIGLHASMTGYFEGRGYSPMWEVFAGSDRLTGPCLQDPNNSGSTLLWDNGDYCRNSNETIPYPGITHIENYLNIGSRLTVDLQLTKYFHGSIGVGLAHDFAHNITYADAGRNVDNNGFIDLDNPREVNPMYRPLIDAPGRRFRVEESTIFDFFFNLTGQF
ncbi:MAG: hypothetical protein JRH20_12610 [Deltaproteobacteria bacterium]|nr:hypothetical protein [Deltaproteobacteria bacterium]